MKSHASMNRIYRLVWNAALSVWVAVAENAKGQGKAGSARNKAALLMLVPLAGLMHQARAADAANATVSAGAASVSTVGNTTTVNQASQRAAIDWTSLSTRANEALIFNQPNAQAIALNRITGSSPSELLGSLTANGQVFILNPNGVLFGAGSQVNVGGLVASTLSLSNADFEAGNYKFTGSGGGSVVNQGTLNAAPGGYLALLAPEVRNEGVMTASLGTALLAAGNKVTLNLDNGSLLGYSIDQGAVNALAENKQLIKADGGQVLLSAKAMNSLTTATVNNTGVIEAKTIQNKAGRILLMGDMDTGTVNVGGTLDASAPNGGDGGFIETSAAHVKVADGAKVTTLAGGGKHGTWLIDPVDFTVADSGGDISGATLGANLGAGNVVIQSVNGAAGVNGDVNVNSAVTWNAGTTLTLNAVRNININASITSQHADGKLALEYGQGALAAGNTGDYIIKAGAGINLAAGQNFSTRLGSDGVRKDYTVITSLGAEGSTTGTDLQGMNGGLAGNYALGGDIDAAATALWESGAGFMPVATGAPFTGTFAGLGHRISHLTINRPNSGYVGLIGRTDAGAMVRDVGMVDATVSGYDNVGALVGRNENGTIRNSYTTGSVWGGSEAGSGAGGLVGINVGGSIRNSYSTASVAGKGAQIGGLVGLNWMGTIDGSYATGDVTSDYYTLSGGSPYIARGHQVGGLLGNNYQGTVSNSYATGNVSASGKQVGGLVGMNESGTITNSHALGNVVADRGNLRRDSGERVGGLAGENYSGTISNSYATGNVSAPWIYTGGLVGYNNGAASRPGGTIINSYATGNVSGIRWVGGLVGYDNVKGVITNSYATGDVTGSSQLIGGLLGATTEGTITNTYATGKVTLTGPSGGASDYIGGLIGSNTRSNVTNSYWNRDTSGQGSSAAGTGLSSAQFQQQASFGGLDFNNVWVIYEGHTSPLLCSFMKVLTVTANVTKVYDGAAYAFNSATDASYSLIADPALLNGTLGNSGASEGAIHVSQSGSAITLGGLWSGQQGYLINYANSSLTITPKTITVAATGVDKVYNGDAAATVTLAGTGVIAGDLVDFSSASASFSDKNAGAGKTVTVSGISMGGAGAGDYILAGSSASTTADITRKAITVAATADNKVYDGNATAGVSLASGDVVAGDTVNFSSTAASFDDKNAGTGKAVTVSGISAGGADAGNYSVNSGASAVADITRKSITVTATADNKIYDGNTAAGVALASSGVVSGDTVNFANTAATFADKNAGLGKAVAVSGISAGGTDAGNYSFNSDASTSADITPKALAVTGVTAADKVYDQGTGAVVSTAAVVYTGLIAGDAVSASVTGAFTDKNAGAGKTVNLTSSYSGADVGNYAITGQATTTASISQAVLTVSGITAADKTYNASDAATVNTAGASYSGLFAGDVVSVNATGVFSDKNAGAGKTVNLSSSYGGADAGNYAITGQATTSASIAQASLTLSSSDVVKTYDAGTSAAGTAVVTGGTLYAGDTLSGGSFAFANKNAGAGDKVVNVSGVTVGDGVNNGNYNVSYADNTTSTIHKATLTVTGVVADNKTYDAGIGATLGNSGTLAGLMSGEALTLNNTGASFADKNAGTGKLVTATYGLADGAGGLAANYQLAATPVTTTANIDKAALIVSGITASDKTYNASDAATVNTAGASYSGLFAGDLVSVAATGVFSDKNAGAGKTVNLSSSYGGADAGNYAITGQASTTATIHQAALTISGITASDKSYNASDAATVNTAGAAYNGLFAGDVVSVTATGLFSDKNAGTGKTVNLSSSYGGADAGNYAITHQASTTATITQAALTVSGITAADKTYNASDAATVNTAGASYSGLFADDVVAVNATGLFSDKNVGTGKTVTLSSTYSGADAGNYTITSQAGTTASISQAALTVSGITASDKTYNASDAATVNTAGASYGGLFAGDVVTVAATGLFSDKNAGAGKTVNLSSSYSGADLGNYTITSQATTTASISQAALTVSGITAADKTYDAGTAATVNTAGASYSGLFAGDVVNVAATGLFSDKNAGAGKTVNLSSSFTGADAGNYAITSQAGTTAAIHKADLTVQATGNGKVYDGTTAAGVTFSANGLAGDVLSVSGNASFADANAGLNKAVSVNGIAVGGADAGNYNLVSGSTASTSADITPKALTVTANNDTRLPGSAYAGGNGVSYSGFVAGETAAVLGGVLAYGGSSQGANAMGTYGITPGGLVAGNYRLDFVAGVLTLQAADASVAALGSPVLAGAYDGARNSAGSPVGFRLALESGGSGGDAGAGGSLNAAAAAREEGGE